MSLFCDMTRCSRPPVVSCNAYIQRPVMMPTYLSGNLNIWYITVVHLIAEHWGESCIGIGTAQTFSEAETTLPCLRAPSCTPTVHLYLPHLEQRFPKPTGLLGPTSQVAGSPLFSSSQFWPVLWSCPSHHLFEPPSASIHSSHKYQLHHPLSC